MHVLDATDRRILTVLDADPRATVQAIAYRLGLARGTVHTRLDKLQTSGALRANSLRLDPPALGCRSARGSPLRRTKRSSRE